METLINLLIFLGKLLLLMFLLGVPFILLVVFIADKVYRKVGPKYEELRDRKIEEMNKAEKRGENKK